ncbi:MAG: DUF1643 domain-containing protein [Selenomonadales bacterium]|nr:DUF1643 domain-containing protein [Selenomonadales bacterium]
MLTEKATIKCEVVFSDDHTHRFLWKRIWDKMKPIATVIMLNPCESDGIITDTTTSLVINNVARLEEFGGVAIVNLYSMLTSKLNFKWNSDADLNHEENDGYIMKAVEEASKVILAWGRAEDTNKRVEERVGELIKKLSKHKEKLFVISDGAGRYGMHPLTPALRNRWILESYEVAKEKRKEQEKAKAELLAKVEAEKAKLNPNSVRMQYKPLPDPAAAESKPQENVAVQPPVTADEPIKAETDTANETVTEA